MSPGARHPNVVLATVLTLLLLTVPTASVVAQEMHGGAIPNKRNQMVVVEGEAENPLGLSAGYGSVVVRETLTFANEDPNLTTNYGIAFISPVFEWDDLYPRVTSYRWEYEVANYTVQLVNMTSEAEFNLTGVTTDTLVIDPEDLNPDEPGQPDPKVNTTYVWNALVVDTRGVVIMTNYGGYLTTSHNTSTVVDLAPLELPPIGPNTFKANDLQLFDMTIKLLFEPHPTLTAGFYRVYIGDMVFHCGTSFTVVVQYRGELSKDKVVIDKLIFQARPIDIDIYVEKGMEVKVSDSMAGEGALLSPSHVSEGEGDPTSYQTNRTHSIVVQKEGTDGTDWGMVGRYAALFGIIALLIIVILWSGPKREDEEEDDEEEGEDDQEVEGDEGGGGPDGDEVPDRPPESKRPKMKERDLDKRREELETRKANLINEIKSVDARHDDGALTDKEWKATRAALKERAVKVMKQLEDLEDGSDGD